MTISDAAVVYAPAVIRTFPEAVGMNETLLRLYAFAD